MEPKEERIPFIARRSQTGPSVAVENLTDTRLGQPEIPRWPVAAGSILAIAATEAAVAFAPNPGSVCDERQG